jgi:CelD/BcsL family acetyltransferase involved in cellulose biosynthesis
VHGTLEILRIEWRPLVELAQFAEPWRALAARALEPNVFYEPAFGLAAAPVLGRDVSVALVWSRAAPAQLLGFFPARIERRYGLGPRVLVGWTHPFAPLGTPLVDRDAPAAVISAWLDHLARRPDLPRLLLIPYLPESGAVARVCATVLAQRNGKQAAFGQHQRALLAPHDDKRTHYLDHAIGARKRKELRRQRKRLADTGELTSSIIDEPAAIAAAFGDFLTLEASGWKGRAGTAARADDGIRVFMESAVVALAREGKVRIARLTAAGRLVAALVTLQSGATAWCWKIAYDEAFARFSPGVQLLTDMTQALLDDTGIACADSCATAGHPMIDHIWRERLALADQLLRNGPQQGFAFTLACTLEHTRRAAIACLKRLRDRIRS